MARGREIHGNTKYPWEDWFRTAQFEPVLLTKGKDFYCDVATFKQSCRNRAQKEAVKIQIRRQGMMTFTIRIFREMV